MKSSNLLITIISLEMTASLAISQSSDGIWTGDSPNHSFFAATRNVPDEEMIWKTDLDNTRLVIFQLDKEKDISDHVYFTSDIGGRIVEQAKWSKDSRFLVITTSSSGGHSPWHYTTYVVSIADKRLACVDNVSGLCVVKPDFKIIPPHTAVLGTAKIGSDGIDFEHPVSTPFNLASLFKK